MKGAREQDGKMLVDLVDMEREDRWASLQTFADCINNKKIPETSGEDNMNTLAMVLAARQSDSTGEGVRISDILR
jgi:predicted dehydrogenase